MCCLEWTCLFSPQGRRFRSRNELRLFFEEIGEPFKSEMFDFCVSGKKRMSRAPDGNSPVGRKMWVLITIFDFGIEILNTLYLFLWLFLRYRISIIIFFLLMTLLSHMGWLQNYLHYLCLIITISSFTSSST